MSRGFDVDGTGVKVDASLKAAIKPDTSSLTAENVEAGLALLGQLESSEDFDIQNRLGAALQKTAAALPALRAAVQTRMRDVAEFRAAHDRVAPFLEKLKSAPDDPAANLSVGSFACFYQRDWEKGLPMLAKSTDAKLKAAAVADLAAPTNAEQQFVVAGIWWDLAKSVNGLGKTHVLERAGNWYSQAAPNLSGLNKALAEKRSVVPDHPGIAGGNGSWINLLAMINPAKNTRAGKWKLENGILTSDNQNGARMWIPYLPPEEYDFRIVLSRSDGDSAVLQFAARGEHEMIWCMGYNKIFVLNEKHQDIKCELVNGRKYKSVIKVRKDSVQFFLDDQKILEEKDEEKLFQRGLWNSLSDEKLLGVGSFFSPTAFYSIEIQEVTGKGKALAAK